MVGQAIRNTIIKVGGTTPEKLPTPEKSIKFLKEIGITNFRVDLLDEEPNEVKQIITNIKNVL